MEGNALVECVRNRECEHYLCDILGKGGGFCWMFLTKLVVCHPFIVFGLCMHVLLRCEFF